MTESQRRTLRIVRWPLLFVVVGGLVAWWAFVSAGGCAPGPPEFKASDLIEATVKNMYPAGGGAPLVNTIDLSKTGEFDKLLAAYRSMKPANETGRITSPDLYLDLKLKADREIVVVLEKDIPQFVEVREYRGGTLTGTLHLRPGAMFDYLLTRSWVGRMTFSPLPGI